jgi:Transposase DDE domain
LIEGFATEAHQQEFSAIGQLYHGLKVLIPDGTLCLVPRTTETIEVFGLGGGKGGDAYYPQARIVGFYELSTGTFEHLSMNHYKVAERAFMLEHAKSNTTPTLYMTDAGYYGIGMIAITNICCSHDVLMRSKSQSAMEKKFRKSRERSSIHEITITDVHLKTYPEFKPLKGQTIKVRLIRTRGTSKLKSMILITTLLDEEKYSWQELSMLYLQRYKIELAFRHLKTKICIEKIIKIKLNRIMQLIHSAVLLFNLSAMLRNAVKKPSLMPEKKGVKVYCLELCTEFVDSLFAAIIRVNADIMKTLCSCMKSIEACYSILRPWRTRERICRRPPSAFTKQKTSEKNRELQKANDLKPEYEILGHEYDML